MRERTLPSREEITELLDYDPISGVFCWKSPLHGGVRIGSVAGSLDRWGYRRIRIRRKAYSAHHLAWIYMNGDQPFDELDHRDGNPDNNRIDNLRPATRRQNIANQGISSSNKSGKKGVFWCKSKKKWRAFIREEGGRNRYLGCFTDLDLASDAYEQAAKSMYGEFAKIA